jgi:hypothetical protein
MDPRVLQDRVDTFNQLHKVGTAVIVQRDDGTLQKTKTRSAAQILSGHSAVIWLQGISGCYALERVCPLPENAQVGLSVEHALRIMGELQAAGLGEQHYLVAALREQVAELRT